MDFVGPQFDGNTHEVRLGWERIWRLRLGIGHLLSRGGCSGHQLEKLVGHITWAALLRRESLSFLSGCYKFMRESGTREVILWPVVARELRQVSALLLLVCAFTNLAWNPVASIFGSSSYGYATLEKNVGCEVSGRWGRHAEKWRYRHEDSTRAREHALRDPLRVDPVSLGPLYAPPPCDADPEFEEIDRDILMDGDWKFLYASQWRRREDILRTGGRAMLRGARHKLRVPENINMKHVLLVGNLGLALACGTERAASPHLAPILRGLCALSLCTGAKFSVRWVPSELNPADALSRRSPVPSAPAYVNPLPVGHGSAVLSSNPRSRLPTRRSPPVQKRRARSTAESLLWGRLTVALELHLSASLSRFQTASASPSTARQYVFHLSLFLTWWRTISPPLLLKTRGQIDRALTFCFDDLFNDGHNSSTGNKICAALLHFVPDHGGRIHLAFPRATRSLRGWERLRQSRSCEPMPILMLHALTCTLLAWQWRHVSAALALLVSFSGYLRPRELTELKVQSLLQPAPLGGAHFRFWAFRFFSEQGLVRSKTGNFDDAITLDHDFLSFAAPFFSLLSVDRPPSTRLWPFTRDQLHEHLRRAAAHLGLENMNVCLFKLRHGGTSRDVLTSERPVLNVKHRGRWTSDSSLRRYQKSSLAQSELSRMPANIVTLGLSAAAGLPDIFHNPQVARNLLRQHAPGSTAATTPAPKST